MTLFEAPNSPLNSTGADISGKKMPMSGFSEFQIRIRSDLSTYYVYPKSDPDPKFIKHLKQIKICLRKDRIQGSSTIHRI